MKPSSLVLPPGAAPRYRCEVPGCGQVFWDAEEMTRHVRRCAPKNREAIEEAARRHRASDPLEHVVDEEALEYQRRTYGLF